MIWILPEYKPWSLIQGQGLLDDYFCVPLFLFQYCEITQKKHPIEAVYDKIRPPDHNTVSLDGVKQSKKHYEGLW